MKTKYIRDIMVPLSEYATVPVSASIMDAIFALEDKKRKHNDKPYLHLAVLVVNEKGNVVGKLSQVDIIAVLEPNYQKIGSDLNLGRFGFSLPFIKAIREQFDLWNRPVEELCAAVKNIKVGDVMYKPTDGQMVNEMDTIDMAMHQIVMGRHHSLLVTRGKNIVGVLRSNDVFYALYERITTSEC